MTAKRKIGLCFSIAFISAIAFLIAATSTIFLGNSRLSTTPDAHQLTGYMQLLWDLLPACAVYFVLAGLSVAFRWSHLDNLSLRRMVAVSVSSGVASLIFVVLFFLLIDQFGSLKGSWLWLCVLGLLIVGIVATVQMSLRCFGLPTGSESKYRMREILAFAFDANAKRKTRLCLAIAFISAIVFLVAESSAEFAWLNWTLTEPVWPYQHNDTRSIVLACVPLSAIYLVTAFFSLAVSQSHLDTASKIRVLAVSICSGVASAIVMFLFNRLPINHGRWLGLSILTLPMIGFAVIVLTSLRHLGLPAKRSFERTTQKMLAFGCALLVILFAARAISDMYSLDQRIPQAYNKFKASSHAARWWRCQGTSRPSLANGTRAWQLQYSWDAEAGPHSSRFSGPGFLDDGDIHSKLKIDLSSTGSLIIRSKKRGEANWTEHPIQLTQQEISELARAADDTGLLCQSSEIHKGYTVFGLGRYTIQVVADGWKRDVEVDGCRSVPDLDAWFEVFAVLEKHPALPEEVHWWPHAIFETTESCSAADSNEVSQANRQTQTHGGAANLEISGDDLVRLLFGFAENEPLNNARFKKAVLSKFPTGSSWTDVQRRVQQLIAAKNIGHDAEGRPITWLNDERHAFCSVSEDSGYIGCSLNSARNRRNIFRHYSDWHFVLHFATSREAKAVQEPQELKEVYADSFSLESSCIAEDDKKCIAELRAECEANGGGWRDAATVGRYRGGCIRLTKDKGQRCIDSSQCEGTCSPDHTSFVGQPKAGKWETLFGGSPPDSCHCSGTNAPLPIGMVVELCTEQGTQGFLFD